MNLRIMAIAGAFLIIMSVSSATTAWFAATREAALDRTIDEHQEALLERIEAVDATVSAVEDHWRSWVLESLRPVVTTAYNSVPWQTDDDPWVTASGMLAGQGTIALSRNLIRAESDLMRNMGYNPAAEIAFGDTVFVVYVLPMVVRDTMNRRYSDRADIWTADVKTARAWGVRRTYLAY